MSGDIEYDLRYRSHRGRGILGTQSRECVTEFMRRKDIEIISIKEDGVTVKQSEYAAKFGGRAQ
jgi:hypothetical protein